MSELEPAAPPAVVHGTAELNAAGYTDADYTISDETARRLLTRQPENTRLAYDRHWDLFTRWCDAKGRVPLPATAQTLADYTVHLIGNSPAPRTIELSVWTIRSKHTDAGYGKQPDTRRTIELLRAYKREWADEGGRADQATPILIDALRAMASTCDPDAPLGIRDRSLLLLGFNGMCRRSELSGLDIGDVISAADEGVSLYIRYSKTDKDAQGAKVSIPFGQYAETCAVRATRAWTEVLSGRGMNTGPLYRPVDRHGRIGGGHLSGKSISDIVRRRAALAGLPAPDGYSGHSLRAGGATSAYLAGAPVSEIAKHGRWRENSPVVLGYIRAVDQWRNNPMKGIGL